MVLSLSTLAAEYHVGPGDLVQPVLDGLQPGDTLLLDKGEYTQSLVLNNRKGTATAPITIDGAGTARIHPSARDGVLIEDCEHVVVKGVTVQNAARVGIIVFQSREITIRNCVAANNGKWGVQTCLSDGITVEDCDISGSVREHGIYFSSTDRPVVRNCRIHHNPCCGIHLNGDKAEGGDGMITGGLIEGNRIYENGLKGGAAINMDGVENSVITNNVIFDNHAGGIANFVEDGAHVGTGNRISDNVVSFRAGEGRYALQLRGDARQTIVTGNKLSCGRGPVMDVRE